VTADSAQEDAQEIMYAAQGSAAKKVVMVDKTAKKVGQEREIVERLLSSVTFMQSAEQDAKGAFDQAESAVKAARAEFDEASEAKKQAMVNSEHKEQELKKTVAQKKQLDEAVKSALAAKIAAESVRTLTSIKSMEARELLIGADSAAKENEEQVKEIASDGLMQNELGGFKAPKHLGHHHAHHQTHYQAQRHAAQHHAQHQAEHHAHADALHDAHHHAQHQVEHHAQHDAHQNARHHAQAPKGPHHSHHNTHHHKV
jgi:hypothetical protein